MKLRLAFALSVLAACATMASAADSNISKMEFQAEAVNSLMTSEGEINIPIDNLPNAGVDVIAGRLFLGWDAPRVISTEDAEDLILETPGQVKVSGSVQGGTQVPFGTLTAETITENERLVWWSRPLQQAPRVNGSRDVRAFLYPGDYTIKVSFQYKQGADLIELTRTIPVHVSSMDGFPYVCSDAYGDIEMRLTFSSLQPLQDGDVLNWNLEGWGTGATYFSTGSPDDFWPYSTVLMRYSPEGYQNDLADRYWNLHFSSGDQSGGMNSLYFPPLQEIWSCEGGGKG